MTDRKYHWRADFRLHAMDLKSPPVSDATGGEHWILQDRPLRDMLRDLENARGRLLIACGEAPDNAATSVQALLHKLGYADHAEPKGLLASASFIAGFLAACTRERFRIEREMFRLSLRAPRSKRWSWL